MKSKKQVPNPKKAHKPAGDHFWSPIAKREEFYQLKSKPMLGCFKVVIENGSWVKLFQDGKLWGGCNIEYFKDKFRRVV